MTKKTSYFKVDRKIQGHWLWDDKPFARGQAWIDLVMLATFKDHKTFYRGTVKEKKRGEVHVSIGFLATRWGWSSGKVKRFLRTLENEKMILTNGLTNGTVITIENYTFYQGRYQADGLTNELSDGLTDGLSDGLQKNNVYKKEKKCLIKKNKEGFEESTLSPEGKAKWDALYKKYGGTN